MLMFLFIACNTEEEIKKVEENKKYQKVQSFLNKYKAEFQVSEIIDSTFDYTQDYQVNYVNKDIILVCGEDDEISGEDGTMYLSKIKDVFIKNDSTYLQISCESKNLDFKIYGVFKCSREFIENMRKKNGSTFYIIAHISTIEKMMFSATGQGDEYGYYSVEVDMEKEIIVFSGECKKIMTVD